MKFITDGKLAIRTPIQTGEHYKRTDGQTDGQTDGRTDGCYQVHYLPRFAVDNENTWELHAWRALSLSVFLAKESNDVMTSRCNITWCHDVTCHVRQDWQDRRFNTSAHTHTQTRQILYSRQLRRKGMTKKVTLGLIIFSLAPTYVHINFDSVFAKRVLNVLGK